MITDLNTQRLFIYNETDTLWWCGKLGVSWRKICKYWLKFEVLVFTTNMHLVLRPRNAITGYKCCGIVTMHSVYNERESGEKVLFGGRACVLGQSVVFTDSVLCLAWARHLANIWSHLDFRTLDPIQSGSPDTSRHLISGLWQIQFLLFCI